MFSTISKLLPHVVGLLLYYVYTQAIDVTEGAQTPKAETEKKIFLLCEE